jgi:hypothetical protein
MTVQKHVSILACLAATPLAAFKAEVFQVKNPVVILLLRGFFLRFNLAVLQENILLHEYLVPSYVR